MPSRTQTKIRRDINRLGELVTEHAPTEAPLAAIKPEVDASVIHVDGKWRAYQSAAITARKEIRERKSAVGRLNVWNRKWRSVLLIKVPGAAESIHALPSSGATPDDVVKVGQDLKDLIETRPEAASFRDAALADLGTKLDDAARDTREASVAVPAKETAADEFAKATLEANTLLVQALNIVRNTFGPTSREYKQFIGRASPAEEEEDERDSNTGEEEDDVVLDGTDTDGGDTDTGPDTNMDGEDTETDGEDTET